MAFSGPSLAGQKAALRARLGVAPLNKDLVDGDFRILDERDGLPPLGDAWLILHVRDVGRESAVAELARLLRRELKKLEPFAVRSLQRGLVDHGRVVLKRVFGRALSGRHFPSRVPGKAGRLSQSTSQLTLAAVRVWSLGATLSGSSRLAMVMSISSG